jgi:anti-anti-sigma factor
MLGSQFALTASRDEGTLRLSLAGEFDRARTGRVERAVEEALEVPTEHVVLDLGDVTFLDLGAVRTLLKTHARACEYGVELTVVRPRGTARRIFTLTRVGDVLPVTDGNAASIASPVESRPPAT